MCCQAAPRGGVRRGCMAGSCDLEEEPLSTGGFEQRPTLWTLPSATSGTSRHTCGCTQGMQNWGHGHGQLVTQGLGLSGRDSATQGRQASWEMVGLCSPRSPGCFYPDEALGTRGTLAAKRYADPCQPALATSVTTPWGLQGHLGATATQVSGLPLIGSSLKVGAGCSLGQELCLIN